MSTREPPFCAYLCEVTNITQRWIKIGHTNNSHIRWKGIRKHMEAPAEYTMMGTIPCSSREEARALEGRLQDAVSQYRDQSLYHCDSGERLTEYFKDDHYETSHMLNTFMHKHDINIGASDHFICNACRQQLHTPSTGDWYTCSHCTIPGIDYGADGKEEDHHQTNIHLECYHRYCQQYPHLHLGDPEKDDWKCGRCVLKEVVTRGCLCTHSTSD